MASEVLFSPMAYAKYDAQETLPHKFDRMLEKSPLADIVNGKSVCIKIHVGSDVSFSTIPPIFFRKLVTFIKEHGGNCFFTDHYIRGRHPEHRGYTESTLGAPVLDCCGFLDKYYYEKSVDYHTFKHVDVAGLVHDAEVLIDFSHVKGHGCCGLGGACKNIAMGCVSDRTRHQIHGLEGGIEWNEEKCTHCDQCISSCNHFANGFDENKKYTVNHHHCTLCQHCLKVCPTGAITLPAGENIRGFQHGMALCTKTVLDTFDPQNVYYINLLASITALCDCWGMTTPSLVPDIGMMASNDIVAIERASLDAIKIVNLIPQGVPGGMELEGDGHLFERLHGRNPFIQLEELEKFNLGTQKYFLTEIN